MLAIMTPLSCRIKCIARALADMHRKFVQYFNAELHEGNDLTPLCGNCAEYSTGGSVALDNSYLNVEHNILGIPPNGYVINGLIRLPVIVKQLMDSSTGGSCRG